ncbi:MAG: hypothetical protein IJC43_01265 [Clostridia bacterium]|nr:hypothetical protein [Clostridia bacterium]
MEHGKDAAEKVCGVVMYENWEVQVLWRDGVLVGRCRPADGSGEVWQTPPCTTAQRLWWFVDKYFLLVLELFPARHCPERTQLRVELMALARRGLAQGAGGV